MPKVNLGKPDLQRQYEQQLRTDYGKTLTIGDLCDLLSTKDRRTATDWAQGLPFLVVGKRRRWTAEAVAKRMYESTVNV